MLTKLKICQMYPNMRIKPNYILLAEPWRCLHALQHSPDRFPCWFHLHFYCYRKHL